MNISIRTQGTLAIYEQIVAQLKNAIVTGELKAGEALPSIRSLAGQLEVSVITTKRAYEELEKEHLIRSVPGKGFYVCEYNQDYLKEKQYIGLEQRMAEVLSDCFKAGMSKKNVMDMVKELMEDL
ncbi:MAG: GntR family transcriptional regulator [Lachnospiraceae bacterium]|nr:GntR family transcriptional regulator [Lachnospiraceae bacterium]